MKNSVASTASRKIRFYLLCASAAVGGLVIGAGGWAASATIASAVIASGTVGTQGNTKRIQHVLGGVVREIQVSNGAKVKAGQILIRLDGTQASTSLAAVSKEIAQLEARRLRLESERVGNRTIDASPSAQSSPADGFSSYLQSETALFEARHAQLSSKREQFLAQIAQLRHQQAAARERLISNTEEISWTAQQTERTESLADQGLMQFFRLAESKRVAAQLQGQRSHILSDEALASTRIRETNVQIRQLEHDRRTEVLGQLIDTDARLGKLSEQRTALEDQIRHLDIRSPVDGIVHQLAAHTIGGVVSAGDVVMDIVPSGEALTVETRIRPADIDQVVVGQVARLRFSAFSQRDTAEIEGLVETVSADVSVNSQSGETWYSARINIAASERARLGELVLVPGMPVEAFISGQERSALSYLIKPISDQMERAMREN